MMRKGNNPDPIKTGSKRSQPTKGIFKMASKYNRVVLANAIQVALFNEALLPQIIGEGGRWATVRTKGHAEPFKTAKAFVRKDDEEALGLHFSAPKRNYNFNDSNYVNPPATLEVLMAIAKKANGGKDITKKQLQQELEAIKKTFIASAQPIAEAIVETVKTEAEVVAETPAPEEVKA